MDDNRDRKVIAAAGCPRCGAPAGTPCRNPIPHQAHRGTEDRRAQPIRPHSERRVIWSERKRGIS